MVYNIKNIYFNYIHSNYSSDHDQKKNNYSSDNMNKLQTCMCF